MLDLTGPDGIFAGQILADLGADVVQIVPARQSESVGDYHWRAYTRGKRLLEVDPSDGAAMDPLLAGADVFIESLSNEAADRLSLTSAQVAARYPHLVHVSITPFGRAGPKAGYAASDLTIGAASGSCSCPARQAKHRCGFPFRRRTRMPVPTRRWRC